MRPAIFLDRDGVICENREEYVRSWADVAWLPGSMDALRRLAASPFLIVVVTNQSGVGRGVLAFETALEIQRRIEEEVRASGGRIDRTYLCPHTPAENCTCRKPKPGMLLQAIRELDIDPSQSYMVGDALSDIEAGRAACVARSLLVCSGRGLRQLRLEQAAALAPLDVYRDLSDFTAHLLSVSPTL